MRHQRVLFFSAYASWHYHAAVELTLAQALKLRGAEPTVLACDGLFPVCDVHRRNLNPRKADSCERCQKATNKAAVRFDTELRWLSHFLPPDVAARARVWAALLERAELAGARWNGRPVGEWALSSALYQERRCTPDWSDPAFVRLFREQLHGTILALEASLAAFDAFQPDLVVTLNGRFFAHRAALEVARERNIRFVTHERGLLKHTLLWRDGELTHELDGEKKLWSAIADAPLAPAELDFTARVLHERRHGKGMSWSVRYSPPPGELRALREKLALDERPIVALFTSSEDEQAAFPKWAEGAFQDGRDWLDATLEIARATPSHQFVIRMHPGLVSMGENEVALAHARELRSRASENCRVVLPKDDVSSYTLADAADVAVVYYTTLGLEMAARGQRVLCVAAGWYAHAGFTEFVASAERYAETLRAALGKGRDLEIARRALRFAYACFGRWSLPFDAVLEKPVGRGKPAYGDASELAPGRFEHLDRICRFLLEGAALFDSPLPSPRVLETEHLTTMLEPHDEVPPALETVLRAEELFGAGDAEQACELLLSALEEDPRCTRAWRDLGTILHATGHVADAIEAFERALLIDPDDADARTDLALLRA